MKTSLASLLSPLLLIAVLAPAHHAYAQAAAPAHTALASRELIEDYFKKAGVDRQVTELAKSIPASIDGTLAEVKEITPERRQKIVQAARRIFSVQKVNDVMRRELGKTVRAEDLKVISAFFDTPLGKRIAELEVAAAGMDPNVTLAKAAELSETLPKTQPKRFALFERLDAASKLTESTVAMMENTSIAAMRAVIATSGKNQVFDMDAARKQHVDQSKEMMKEMRPQMVATLAVIYASASEDEVSRYVQVLESPGGRRMSESLARAFNALFIELGAETGRALGERAA